jgi:hypothetical protein
LVVAVVTVMVCSGGAERAFGALDGPHGTAVLLDCEPEPVEVNRASTCTVRVEDTETDPTPPTGPVGLATDGQGTFGGGPTCTLGASAGRRAFCQFTYTPTAVGDAVHRITVSYQGDPAHSPSADTADVGVLNGTVRFAAPGGTGPEPCEPTSPCSLDRATDGNRPGTALRAGDEIVISPGTYSGNQDLGADRTIQLPPGVYLHGVAGQPRPLIAQDNTGSPAAMVVETNDRLSHIEIETNAINGIFFLGDSGTAEGLVVRATGRSRGIACNAGAMELLIRDTACIASGPEKTAIGADATIFRPATTVRLRNVTAFSTEGIGMAFRVTGSGQVPTYLVDAVGVIAKGAVRDVEGEGGVTPQTRSELSINLRNSAFATTARRAATVTFPDEAANVPRLPVLAADGMHQQPGSPTIDAGVTDRFSGAGDLDGEARVLGLVADIGADEFQPNTTTSLTCTATVGNGEISICTATVTRRGESPSAPVGTVRFASEGVGEFSNGGACVLGAGTEAGQATCQITYTTESVGPHGVTAVYQGNGLEQASQGGFLVTATGEKPTEARLACEPSPARAREASLCTATVTDVSAEPAQLRGNVSFSSSSAAHSFPDGNACALDGAGPSVSCSVPYRPEAAGEDTITASYQDDSGGHRPSAATLQLPVEPALTETETELVCASPVEVGTASSCTATVVGDAEATTAPSGRVSFTRADQGTFTPAESVCDLLPVEGVEDRASCRIAYTPAAPGNHRITASYEGAGTHLPSAREATIAAVAQSGEARAQSTTELRCDPATVERGRPSACTATVTGLGPNPSGPAGEVEFTTADPGDFSSTTCELEDPVGNAASCRVSYTPTSATPARHRLEATYQGSLEHGGSAGALALTVTEPVDQPSPRPKAATPVAATPRASAPNTTLRKKPRRKTAQRKALFRFVSDRPGSIFQCKLDEKPFKPCRSPFERKVKPGRHTFQVRAVDPQGVADPTPAVFKWTVGGTSASP